MKVLFLVAFIIAAFHYNVDSAAVKFLPTLDLEVGTLGPNDELLAFIAEGYNPIPSVTLIQSSTKITLEGALLTYITVEHLDNYPDARVELTEGGPGYNFFNITFFPGPLGGYNYTASSYGVVLENGTDYTVEARSNKIYN